MEYIETAVKWAVALVATAASYLWGGWDTALQALLALMIIDYATGVGAAFVQRKLSSAVGARGIVRKVGIWCIIAVANVVDYAVGLGDPILRTATAWFYVANEALSCIENLSEIGIPIPTRLTEALDRLRSGEVGRDGR